MCFEVRKSHDAGTTSFFFRPGLRALGSLTAMQSENGEDQDQPNSDEFLQTKTIPNEAVRVDIQKWTPSMQAEYDSLTKETQAVRPLTDSEFEGLIRDPSIQCELVPGRAIFTVKAHTGRLKTRAVACGNHQTSMARTREDKFASGISAEATRMLIRFAGLHDLRIGVIDIKTAFLNAPVVTPNQEVVIVRVPSIMRAAGVCQEKYWIVDKALYGLDVAPRSWSLHRNKVISSITSLEGSNRKVRCLPMEEDANVWMVVDSNSDEIIAYLALYVDDIMLVGKPSLVDEVAQTLASKWTTIPVSWSEIDSPISFDGFEVEKSLDGYRVHQNSYLREILKQYDHVEGLSSVPCQKEVSPVDVSGTRAELTRQAQCITGQLLWLSGRTRPDISFAVSCMGQGIVHDPLETIARGFHLIKFLRQSPEVALAYGHAPDQHGQWGPLKWKQTERLIEVFSDASFLVDSESRSVGSSQMFWGGAIIMWHCGRQPLLSASTAEAELIAMAEAFNMGRSLRPFAEALSQHKGISCRAGLYTDNAAALQLCTLDAGSWRTRHLRLRGNMIRQAIDQGEWSAAHLEGVYMQADIGTKPVGPSRFEDLVSLLGLYCPHLEPRTHPPNPKVAAIQTGVTKLLLALILLSQPNVTEAQSLTMTVSASIYEQLRFGFAVGFGGYVGWNVARWLHHVMANVCCSREVGEGLRCPPMQGAQVQGLHTVSGLDSPTQIRQGAQVQGLHTVSGLDSPTQIRQGAQVQGLHTVSGLDSPTQIRQGAQVQACTPCQGWIRPRKTRQGAQVQGLHTVSGLDSPTQIRQGAQVQGLHTMSRFAHANKARCPGPRSTHRVRVGFAHANKAR